MYNTAIPSDSKLFKFLLTLKLTTGQQYQAQLLDTVSLYPG